MKTLALVLCFAAAGFCQSPSVTPDSQSQPSGPGTPPGQATVKPSTVRGCLSSVGDDFTVTDQVSGKTYKLSGSTDRLKQYIGHTVEITGSIKMMEAQSKPSNSDTGQILTLADVKSLSDTCQSGQRGGIRIPGEVLLALMQRPVNADANTQLDSAAQMSSNEQDTSAAAASTRSVTTRSKDETLIPAGGHTGAHGLSVTTSTTNSVGVSTSPTSSAGGYATTRDLQGAGVAPISPQAYNPANQRSEMNRDKNPVPSYLNPEDIGHSEEDGNRAAAAASRAEMQTDSNGAKTTFSTMPGSEANGTPRANPKEKLPPAPNAQQESSAAKQKKGSPKK